MYDHNQTLVPDSFLELFVRRGRLTAAREAIEKRYEFVEDLALHIAALPDVAAADGESGQAELLGRCRDGLRAEPAQVSDAEAGWVVRRVAELRGWEWVEPGIA